MLFHNTNMKACISKQSVSGKAVDFFSCEKKTLGYSRSFHHLTGVLGQQYRRKVEKAKFEF